MKKNKYIYIGITGLKRSGKDTIADWLNDNHDFYKISFADSLKSFAKEYFDWNGKKDLKNRKILNSIGTLMRAIDEDVFIKMLDKKIKKDNPQKIVIPDIRALREINYLLDKRDKNTEVYIIKIIRKKREKDLNDNHLTETQLKYFTFKNIIHNNDSIEQFYKEIRKWYWKILHGFVNSY